MSIPVRSTASILILLLSSPVVAQDSGKQLDLHLAPDSVPSSAASVAPASSSSVARQTPPGVYYGDTSGRIYPTPHQARVAPCDDDRYGQTQIHGSVGAGVMMGSHVSGQSQTATVNLSKAFGSCEHPTGGISISIGVRKNNVHVDGPP